MLKHSYLLTSLAERQSVTFVACIISLCWRKYVGGIHSLAQHSFLWTRAPLALGGHLPGRGWGGGEAVPLGRLSDCPRSLACCRRPRQSSAVGWGPWQPAWLTRVQWDRSHYQGSASHQKGGWWQFPSGSAVLSFPPGPSSSALGFSPQRISWASTFCLFHP